MDAMKASDNLRGFVDAVAKLSTWALVPLVVITMWDVVARKFIFIQIFMVENFGSIFESTYLQELEWHPNNMSTLARARTECLHLHTDHHPFTSRIQRMEKLRTHQWKVKIQVHSMK